MTRMIPAFLLALGCHLGLLFVNPLPDKIEPPPLHSGAISVNLGSGVGDDSHLKSVREKQPAAAELLPSELTSPTIGEAKQQGHSPQPNERPHPEQAVINPPEQVPRLPVPTPAKLPASSVKIRHHIKSRPLANHQVVKTATNVGQDRHNPSTSPQPLTSRIPGETGDRSTPDASHSSTPLSEPMLAVSEPTFGSHKNAKPHYPPIARERGWQGVVELDVQVGINGLTQHVSLYRSSGYTVLDSSAINAVRKWTFSPGKKNGRVVAMKVRVPVHFMLD